jgi:hypothetical protein
VLAGYWRLAGITGGLGCAAGALPAQLAVSAALGARYTSTLVHDSIVTPFDVRPALAPALAVTAATPVGEPWTAQVTLDFSTSTLERHDPDGTTTGLGRVSALAFTVGLRRPLAAGFAAALGVGALKYLPANAAGIFRQGSGAMAGLGTITVEYAPAAGARYGLGVQARYDAHRFITPALQSEGFDSPRLVHRVTLAVRAGWGGGAKR